MTRFFKKSFFYSISLLMLSSLFVTIEASAGYGSEYFAIEYISAREGDLADIRKFVLKNYPPRLLPSPPLEISSPLQQLPRDPFSVIASFGSIEDRIALSKVSRSGREWRVSSAYLKTTSFNKITTLRQKEKLDPDEAQQLMDLTLLNRVLHEGRDDEATKLPEGERLKAYDHAWHGLSFSAMAEFEKAKVYFPSCRQYVRKSGCCWISDQIIDKF